MMYHTGWLCNRAPRALLSRWHAISTLQQLIDTNHALALRAASSHVPTTHPQPDPAPLHPVIGKSWSGRLRASSAAATKEDLLVLSDLDLAMQVVYVAPTDTAKLADLEAEAARRMGLKRSQRPPPWHKQHTSAAGQVREALAQATQVKSLRSMPNLLSILHALTFASLPESTAANTVAFMRSWLNLPRPPAELVNALWRSLLTFVPGSSVFDHNAARLATSTHACRAIWAMGIFQREDSHVAAPRGEDLDACGGLIARDMDSMTALDIFNLLCGLVQLKTMPPSMPMLPLMTRLAWAAPSLQPPMVVGTLYQLSLTVSLELVQDVQQLISSNSLQLLGRSIDGQQLVHLPPLDVAHLLLAMSRLHKDPTEMGLTTSNLVEAIHQSVDRWNVLDAAQMMYALSHLPVELPIDRGLVLAGLVRCAPSMRIQDLSQTIMRLTKVVQWPPPLWAVEECEAPRRYGAGRCGWRHRVGVDRCTVVTINPCICCCNSVNCTQHLMHRHQHHASTQKTHTSHIGAHVRLSAQLTSPLGC